MSQYERAVKNLKYTEDDLPDLFIITNLQTVIKAFQFDSSSGLQGDMQKAYEYFLKWGDSVRKSLTQLGVTAKNRLNELKRLLKKGTKTDGKEDLQPLKNKMTKVLTKMQEALKQFENVKSMRRAESVLSNEKYRGLQDDVENIAELMNRLNYLHVETSFTKDLINVMKLVRLVLFKLRSDSLVLEYISGKVQECEGSEDFSALLEALENMSKDKEANIKKSKEQKASADKRKSENIRKQREKEEKEKDTELNKEMKKLKEQIKNLSERIRTASTEDKRELEVEKKKLELERKKLEKEKIESKSPKKKQKSEKGKIESKSQEKSEKTGKTGPARKDLPEGKTKQTEKQPESKPVTLTGRLSDNIKANIPVSANVPGTSRAEDLVSNLIHYEF